MAPQGRSWIAHLNPEQQTAALHNDGPMLILAGAGSGKTTVLVSRAGRMIEEGIVSAKRLCVLTFTNKAARELKTRVQNKLGRLGDGLWAGTFHSFGLQILRTYHKQCNLPKQFGIIDQRDASALIKELLKSFRYADKSAFDADKLLSLVGSWRERGQTEATKDEEYEAAAEWILPKYLTRMESLGVVDFDGLLLKPLELMLSDPKILAEVQDQWDQLMVDEFQDTNIVQMRLVSKLVERHKNISVVGDDDQSIYGWRGACVSNILDFPKLYSGCKVVRLETNYRSTPVILETANAVIKKNEKRHSKQLRPASQDEKGTLPLLQISKDETEEVENVLAEINALHEEGFAFKEIAVLYRSNSQGALIEAELRKENLPYSISGGTAFFDRKETRDLIAYLKSSIRPNEVSLRRIINTPSRGIGDRSIALIARQAREKNISFFKSLRACQSAGLEQRAINSILKFLDELKAVGPSVSQGGGRALLQFLDQTGYRSHVEKHSPNTMVASKRWRFVEIFANVLDKHLERSGPKKGLANFLDAMELRDDPNDKEPEKDEIQLLTLHACKGLEFPAVILLGVEEDILPHKRLGGDIAEERRLFYVGITRAQKRLIMTRSEIRTKHGKVGPSPPSRFLSEIPEHLYEVRNGPRPVREDRRRAMIDALYKRLES